MPFTFQALNEDNTVGIAQISITIDPGYPDLHGNRLDRR